MSVAALPMDLPAPVSAGVADSADRSAELASPDSASVFAAKIERLEGRALVVRGDGISLRARRAASCLLAPEAGDRVLVARTGDGHVYVLSVLDRHDADSPERWAGEGDVTIEAKSGRVDVVASEGASISSAREVALRGQSLSLTSAVAKIAVSRLSMLGKEVLGEWSRARVVAETLETAAELVSQTAARVTRVVTEIEHVRAGAIDMAAEKVLAIHAENAMVTAKELVKMDGEAVQLG
jgi:hypothetical protein